MIDHINIEVTLRCHINILPSRNAKVHVVGVHTF